MFLSTCEIMSTIIGALAGSIASSRVKMDLFGVIVCGTLAALGGGTVRDILLDIPVYWTLPSGEIFVLASVVTSLATFYVAQKYPPPMGTIRVADAIVLALFGMIGTEKSYLHGYTPTVSVMMGICTGVAGGLLSGLFFKKVHTPYCRVIRLEKRTGMPLVSIPSSRSSRWYSARTCSSVHMDIPHFCVYHTTWHGRIPSFLFRPEPLY